MTNVEIMAKLKEFRSDELQKLGQKPQEVVMKMTKGDRVIIQDELLDYLRDFFQEVYDGGKIPKVFEKVLIEWHSNNGIINLYVTFPENHEEWIYIDVFWGWKFLGKLLYPNVEISDSERDEQGRFYIYSPFLTVENFDKTFLDSLVTATRDVFSYCFLYVEANRNVETIYEEREVSSLKKNKNANKSKKAQKKQNQEKREKVNVPEKKRVYKLVKTEETVSNLREYIYSRWKVRGYTYTRKDGKKVNVKEHFAFRHLPNKGIVKEEGKDFYLRKKTE